MTPGVAILAVVGVWWLGTGAVFLAARGSLRSRALAFAGMSGVLGGVLMWLPMASRASGVGGLVQGLLLGFGVWMWMELSFYTGFVTGPTTREPPAGAGLGTRFTHALLACLWHELAIVTGAVAIWILSPGDNHWALIQFVTFWVLHEVARLNVLIGVPHPFRELLPEHLSHLQPYLEPRRAGGALYLTLAALALATAATGALAMQGALDARLGWSAISVLVGLGFIEHGVLLFPVPLARLWSWFGVETAPEAVAGH